MGGTARGRLATMRFWYRIVLASMRGDPPPQLTAGPVKWISQTLLIRDPAPAPGALKGHLESTARLDRRLGHPSGTLPIAALVERDSSGSVANINGVWRGPGSGGHVRRAPRLT